MRKYSRYFWTVISLLFIAAYTGPGSRTVTDTVMVTTGYQYGATCQFSAGAWRWVETDTYACTVPRAVINAAYPDPYPGACTAARSGMRVYGSTCTTTPQTTTTTYPPATLSASLSCATPGSAGWCRDGLTLNASGVETIPGYNITAIESSVYGALCAGASCNWSSFPQGVTTQNVWAVSSWGDTSLFTTLTGRLDNVAPTLTANIPVPPASGWYTSPITVSASGADATSGLASAQVQVNGGGWQGSATISADGAYTVDFRALDNAGNQSLTTRSANLDQTPPVIGAPAFGAGWYTVPPSLSATVTDATSGVASSELRANGGAWGASATLSQGINTLEYRASDNAGNQASAGPATVRLDSVAPALSISLPGPDGANGWYVSAVTSAATATDATSGVSSVQTRVNGGAWGASATVSTDGTHTLDFRVTDNAGNAGTTSRTIRIDRTAPTVSLTLPAVDGSNGWYITSPTIDATSSDAGSGISSTQIQVDGGAWQSAPVSISAGTHTVRARTTDNAGNVTTTGITTVRVDNVAPAISVNLPSPTGSNGWYIGNVTSSATATDALSGVASIQVRVDGGAWGANAAASADGAHVFEYRAVDVAGNQTTTTRTVNIDRTPPTLTPSVPAPDGAGGWYVSAPTIGVVGADAGSGVASAQVRVNGGAWQSSLTITSDGSQIVDFQVQDYAGNTTVVSRTINVDRTLPTAILDVPAPDGAGNWYVNPFTASALGTDDGSGIASSLVRLDGGAWTSSVQVATDGAHLVEYRVVDNAGNTRTGSRSVNVDMTPPSLVAPYIAANWYVSPQNFAFTASDGGSGLASLEHSTDGGATWQGGGTVSLADGQHDLIVRARDNAGNQVLSSSAIRIDTISPVSRLTSHDSGSVVGGVVTFSGSVGDSGAGVLRTECSFDDGATWTAASLSGSSWSCSTDTSGSNGDLVFKVRSVDIAGNQEVPGPGITLSVSNLPPGISLTPAWMVWEMGTLEVFERNARIVSIEVQVFDPSGIYPPRTITLKPSVSIPGTYDVFWDGNYGDGTNANYDTYYPVVATVCDVHGSCATAGAEIYIPEKPASGIVLPAVSTPTATPGITPTPDPTEPAPQPVVEVAEPEVVAPPVLPPLPQPQVKPLLISVWLIALVALFAALASSASVDPRPRALRALGKTVDEILKSSQNLE